MTIFHKTKCGCTVKREDMQHTGPSTPYPLRCPNHGDVTKYKFIFCAKCGEKRIVKGNNNLQTILCVSCQQKRNIENMRAHNRKISRQGSRKESCTVVSSTKRAKFDAKKDLERRANCKHAMSVCFRRYEQYNNMPCKKCRKFEQEEYHYDVYQTKEEVIGL